MNFYQIGHRSNPHVVGERSPLGGRKDQKKLLEFLGHDKQKKKNQIEKLKTTNFFLKNRITEYVGLWVRPPSGSRWFPLVPSGSIWLRLLGLVSVWFPLVPSGSVWLHKECDLAPTTRLPRQTPQ